MITTENWQKFTATEHETWQILFKRQNKDLQQRAADEILMSMDTLQICNNKIPKFTELNNILKKETDFSLVAVTGLIPPELFFAFLAERKFPATCFIRTRQQLDYLEEPDIFHDVFGHVPLLVNPIFADFMQEFGKQGLKALDADMLQFVTALYWFTVEFGLIQTSAGLRIYGAGITSSHEESLYALESDVPVRVKFSAQRAMLTQYRMDNLQKTYFVIASYQQLFDTLKELDWHELKQTLQHLPFIPEGQIIDTEETI
jgi:phenylalanine-4-hydroxylase